MLPVNDAPVSKDLDVKTAEETAAVLDLPASVADGDPLDLVITSRHASAVSSSTGFHATYTPVQDFSGTDTFSYRVSDGAITTEPNRVDIEVTPVNDPPTASAVAVETAEDVPVVIALTGSDSDKDPYDVRPGRHARPRQAVRDHRPAGDIHAGDGVQRDRPVSGSRCPTGR